MSVLLIAIICSPTLKTVAVWSKARLPLAGGTASARRRRGRLKLGRLSSQSRELPGLTGSVECRLKPPRQRSAVTLFRLVSGRCMDENFSMVLLL